MNYKEKYTPQQIWDFLSEIPDPEIPVITLVDLGVLREIEILSDKIIVTITPTYSGCPAMKLFEDEIIKKLHAEGIENVELKMVYSPAWTTDWMSDEALKKLNKYGIAPPVKGSNDKGVLFENGPKIVPCPQCHSKNTVLKSQFGSTACKALYQCEDCLEPFDYFKCI
ncbi:MAG: phenylacetate-CoA oxygenase subunit PaaJ [Bacteroidetes bacterium HGW-Bacteroidetes-12]|nr:MAG: phenylacetate-CoA oxygenase subunit PaaJ [Bacteroidetes bacterium HGW-Bacteroidetes-12]